MAPAAPTRSQPHFARNSRDQTWSQAPDNPARSRLRNDRAHHQAALHPLPVVDTLRRLLPGNRMAGILAAARPAHFSQRSSPLRVATRVDHPQSIATQVDFSPRLDLRRATALSRRREWLQQHRIAGRQRRRRPALSARQLPTSVRSLPTSDRARTRRRPKATTTWPRRSTKRARSTIARRSAAGREPVQPMPGARSEPRRVLPRPGRAAQRNGPTAGSVQPAQPLGRRRTRNRPIRRSSSPGCSKKPARPSKPRRNSSKRSRSIRTTPGRSRRSAGSAINRATTCKRWPTTSARSP